MVTLDGALFEKSGTMSGGGGKPRGGKMGTSIRATSVSAEAVTNAEKELSTMVDKLNSIRQKIADAVRHYQASEKAAAHLEMELAKSQKEVSLIYYSGHFLVDIFIGIQCYINFLSFQQIDSLNSQHGYLGKQLNSLEAASRPRKDETDRLEELKKIISAEEKEIDRLVRGSKQLKEKVCSGVGCFFVIASCNSIIPI